MEDWILYGVLAALIWGIYVVLLKAATYRLSPSLAFGGMTLGIVVALAVVFPWKSNGTSFFTSGGHLAFLAGLLWGVGMAFVTRALWLPPTAVSRLTPLYNVNTLVTVTLGILLLQEVPQPSKALVVVLGALLVVVGGYLVTKEPTAKDQNEIFKLAAAIPYAKARKIFGIPEWIVYGVVAILTWGSYIVCLKVAVSPEYYAMEPREAFLMMVLGIVAASSVTFLFAAKGRHHPSGKGNLTVSLWPFVKEKQIRLNNFHAALLAFVSGLLWSIAMLVVIHALSDLEAPVARLTPLYNTNTVVAAGLGFLLLGEARNWKRRHALLVILGAVFVTLGATLVSI